MSRRPNQGRRNVFLNLPFDGRYEPLFVAIIAGLVAVGRKPRCVLEIADAGEGRRKRLLKLIRDCPASVHDLSRVSGSGPRRLPRFNMPFELGVTFALKAGSRHRLFVFDSELHRLQQTLSDMNGVDPEIHDGTQRGILGCILNCFGSTRMTPSLAVLRKIARKLSRVARRLKADEGASSLFQRRLFRQVVEAATTLAEEEKLIAKRRS